VLAILGASFCAIYVYNFFLTWFHTFLVKGRGFTEAGLLVSVMPFALAACANLAGGVISDALVRRLGLKKGRRILGVGALAAAGVFTMAAMFARQPAPRIVFLTLVYGSIALQQSAAFGACLDIGEECAGAMIGLLNTASQLGGLVGAIVYGYIVERSGSYNAPFVPMAALLFLGSLLWLRVDASQAFHPAPRFAPVPVIA
jgi:MFS family permease